MSVFYCDDCKQYRDKEIDGYCGDPDGNDNGICDDCYHEVLKYQKYLYVTGKLDPSYPR